MRYELVHVETIDRREYVRGRKKNESARWPLLHCEVVEFMKA
jgi:hypothetical protein